jgi:iron-sulfur cluster repair protein YtfE (RIC family)
MLFKIGRREAAEDAVALLLECHQRIRKFLTMARELAAARGADDAEIRGVAAQVRRYFVESLPLHIADEHEDIAPRLAGANAEVDRALAAMEAEHGEHQPIIDRLVALCDAIVAEPRQAAVIRGELGEVADRLTRELSVHLEREESVIFPALRALPSAERDAVVAAMRQRRDRALG